MSVSGRTYRTESGSYSESDLAVVIWLNPGKFDRPQARLLETLTDRSSPHPMAFPIRSLQVSLPNPHVATAEDIQERIMSSTRENPVITPLTLARDELGWVDFYVPSTYQEPTT